MLSHARLALAALALSAAPAAACSPGDSSLVGHYYLRGVMEVGSELLLRPDGRFEYMLAYGALDELATGCWSREGGKVILTISRFEHSMDDPMQFDRLELAIGAGALTRQFDERHRGRYQRS